MTILSEIMILMEGLIQMTKDLKAKAKEVLSKVKIVEMEVIVQKGVSYQADLLILLAEPALHQLPIARL